MTTLWDVLREGGVAALPAVGFGMMFNVPVRMLPWVAGAACLGRGLRLGLVQAGLPVEWATLVAATVISFVGVYSAHRLKAHPKVFTIAAVIPMVPGVYLFTTLLALASMQAQGYTPEMMATAVNAGLKGGAIVTALGVGLAIPGLLFYRTRPVL